LSNYTKTVNFATKDNLSPGNPLKIVKGTEIDTEYNNIATAVATKTDNSAAAITGGAIDGATVGSTTPAAGAFTTLAASGTTTLAGALVGAVTQAAFNTTSTTLNLGGAATAVNIGAATGTATVANTTLAAKAITASTTLNVTGASTLTGAVTATAGVTGPLTSSSVAITGGTITGITDLAVADGGTGASTAAGALNNLLPSQTGNANKYLQTDGTNASWDAVSLSTADITGTLAVLNGGTGVTTSTGTTNVVLSNSPTLVTPILGTPTSATLTNATGLPISTGVSGLGTGVATLLATPSSANLASAITDETGTGSLVFATSPTLVTPALGTPSALVGTNITGTASGLTAGNVTTNANLTGAVTSVGNATSLGSFTSSQLLSALTDETGTGVAVFATNPVLTTPNLGTPTTLVLTAATGLPLTSGVTGQLPVANGGTGTSTPSIVAGSNVTVTGTWPNQTIASSGSSGTVTSVAASVPSLFSISGSPITTSGTLAMTYSGTALPVANGGTGQTTYTDGQLLIGNSTGNTLTKTTLTAGSGITITNGNGSISIASSGGASAATPTALGTVYGSMTTSGGSPYLTALGYNAGLAATGVGNVGVGVDALKTVTSGAYNTALGYQALYSGTTALYSNSAVGYQALQSCTGEQNTALGYQALKAHTSNSNSTGIGWAALTASTGTANTALGAYSGQSNTTGTLNVCVGMQALNKNTTGTLNTAVGSYALQNNITSSNSTAVGYEALASSTAANNTATGYTAGTSITSGGANTCIGSRAGTSGNGYSLTTGDRNVLLGYIANLGGSGADSSCIFITTRGDITSGKGSSTGFIDAGGGGVYQGNNASTWSTTSDQRLKKNIVDNNIGLTAINSIRVRNFEYRLPEEITELATSNAIKKEGVQLGVIAQELQAILPDCIKTESTGVLSVNSDNLTWYMINAIKELKAEFDAYKASHP